MTRWSIASLSVAAALATCVAAVWPPLPKLIWNASASVPIGLYAVRPIARLEANELVVIRPPDALARFLNERGYLPRGVPMLKHVAALPGQTVCRNGLAISIDGVTVGTALSRDHLGRSLPAWQGCRVLRSGEVFVMNEHVLASLDGRYFGPLPASTLIGRAVPVWIPQ